MKRLSIAAGVVALVLAVAGSAQAASPAETVSAYTEAVLKVLEDPTLQGKHHEQREAIRKLATEVFDVEETARRALGRHWQGRTPAEREEFVTLFADLLERTYIGRIDRFGGERLRIVDEKVDGTNAVVRGRIVTRQGTEVPVEGRMHRRGDRWLIYDVVVENVSLVANYRSQFDRIIRTASFGELLRRLRTRGEGEVGIRGAAPRAA
ncbi:MAG TPA: ABC transporter substrate-binding protein [Candidatus Tectomicrobia bacterium]|nr:ABC transporter substrate-binding protein [Candidatus Tectomicrobia bacterium]